MHERFLKLKELLTSLEEDAALILTGDKNAQNTFATRQKAIEDELKSISKLLIPNKRRTKRTPKTPPSLT